MNIKITSLFEILTSSLLSPSSDEVPLSLDETAYSVSTSMLITVSLGLLFRLRRFFLFSVSDEWASASKISVMRAVLRALPELVPTIWRNKKKIIVIIRIKTYVGDCFQKQLGQHHLYHGTTLYPSHPSISHFHQLLLRTLQEASINILLCQWKGFGGHTWFTEHHTAKFDLLNEE